MSGYMRKIVGRCYRVTTHSHYPTRVKVNRYSIEARNDLTTRTSFAWRLSCGHVVDGQVGHGKKSKTCYDCQSLSEGVNDKWCNPQRIAEYTAAWTDLADEAAYEAKRREAQS